MSKATEVVDSLVFQMIFGNKDQRIVFVSPNEERAAATMREVLARLKTAGITPKEVSRPKRMAAFESGSTIAFVSSDDKSRARLRGIGGTVIVDSL